MENTLPSKHQINDIVTLLLGDDKLSPCIVKSVKFTESKVTYDLQYSKHYLKDIDSDLIE